MAYGDGAGRVRDRTGLSSGVLQAPVVRLPVAGRRELSQASDPRTRTGLFPELDCIRDRLSPGLVAAAERRAIALGVGAERVLIAQGAVDEEVYGIALARWLGWDYESFHYRSRRSCPLGDAQLIESASSGLIPLFVGSELQFVVAPRSVRQLLDYARRNPRIRFRLTSSFRLNGFIADHAAQSLGDQAANSLRRRWPALSAATHSWRKWMVLLPLIGLLFGALFVVPGKAIASFEMMLAGCFLSWLTFRLLVCSISPTAIGRGPVTSRELPVYTIIVALYREAHSVDALVDSLRALDYPPEKLDIKLVIEADDQETRAALDRLDLGAPFETIVAPQVGPQTKPKALNAALPFAKGTFTVVYDAEDRPETDQLHRAVERFLAESEDVACLQACLTIDNTDDGWLARLFTAEYAAQFDLFLPGLARMGLPLPLGGSSNHFRSDVLRKVGVWDAYNVTEDADLGIRLARFGYRSVMLNSTTYEEAPARVLPWIRQRTRWFKGWIQTWAVHMRHPDRLLRDVGLKSFLTIQLVVGGSVLAALIHPIFAAMLIGAVASGRPLFGVNGIPEPLTWAFMATLAAGYLITIIVGLRGLAQRGLLSSGWWLAAVPFHWLLLSLAAWRALFQFIGDPHSWEKTEHGIAKSSRLAHMNQTAAVHVPGHKHAGSAAMQRRDTALRRQF